MAMKIPHFENEQEEAEWWDSHPDEILAAFEEAAANGTLRQDSLQKHGMKAFEILANLQPVEALAKRKSAA